MNENNNPRIEEINIFEIFEQTKQSIVGDINKITGKAEMLDEITKFFKDKNLHVVRAVEETPEEAPVEVAPVEEVEAVPAGKTKKK